jgi:hypothetical protein
VTQFRTKYIGCYDLLCTPLVSRLTITVWNIASSSEDDELKNDDAVGMIGLHVTEPREIIINDLYQ